MGVITSRLFIITTITLFLSILSGCREKIDMDTESEKLLAADRAFSAASQEVGPAMAFHRFLAADAWQFPAGGAPRFGNQDIYNEMIKSDGKYTLVWEPQLARVSASADMGWTWGTYTLTYVGGDADGKQETGKYVNVWTRSAEGNWQVVADIGNSSPSTE